MRRFLLFVCAIIAGSLGAPSTLPAKGKKESKAAVTASPTPADTILIELKSGNKIWVGGKVISKKALSTMLKEAVAQKPDQTVTLQADKAASEEFVSQIIELCRQAGVKG